MTTAVTLAAIRRRYGVTFDGPQPIAIPAPRRDLPRLCRDLGMRRGVEVGVWKGAYSEDFCRALAPAEWLAVDPWCPSAAYREPKNDATLLRQAYVEARGRLEPLGAQLLRASSLEAAAHVPDRSLDVVYLDGNHAADFVRADLEAWTPKLRPGGLLAGHDYRVPPASKPFLQVKPVVDAWVVAHAIAPWFVLTGDATPSWFWVV